LDNESKRDWDLVIRTKYVRPFDVRKNTLYKAKLVERKFYERSKAVK